MYFVSSFSIEYLIFPLGRAVSSLIHRQLTTHSNRTFIGQHIVESKYACLMALFSFCSYTGMTKPYLWERGRPDEKSTDDINGFDIIDKCQLCLRRSAACGRTKHIVWFSLG